MDTDPRFTELLTLINDKLRLDCRYYNEGYIKRRVNARIMARNLPLDDYTAYLKVLKDDPEESRQLFDTLTVNVTQFFRDSSLWETLAKSVVPQIIKEKLSSPDRTLRVWSCGCASGEEPYSLAILFRELIENKGIRPAITATDIDALSLKRAKEAVYSPQAFETMPQEYLQKYFKQTLVNGKAKYELSPAVRPYVQFVNHNFLSEAPPARNFDMVFCRNVVIYFTTEAKDKLMQTFADALTEHGWLTLGKSEVLFSARTQHLFYLFNNDDRIYRRERRTTPGKIDVERRKNWWYGYVK